MNEQRARSTEAKPPMIIIVMPAPIPRRGLLARVKELLVNRAIAGGLVGRLARVPLRLWPLRGA